MVAMPELINNNNNSKKKADATTNIDDLSEDLQYGPGIVSKLRCRYLNLILRQTADKQQRPLVNQLRRSTSLNNLLDDEAHDEEDGGSVASKKLWHLNGDGGDNATHQNGDVKPLTLNQRHNEYQQHRNSGRARQMTRGNDSLKRARSVEALARYDHNAWHRDVLNDSEKFPSSNPIIIDELPATNEQLAQTNESDGIRDKYNVVRSRKTTTFMNETERPPPDLVKQTLLKFESSPQRKPRLPSRYVSGDVAAKVASYKNIIAQDKKTTNAASPTKPLPPPILGKKPVVKPRLTSPKLSSLNNSNATNASQMVNGNVPNGIVNTIGKSLEQTNGHSLAATSVGALPVEPNARARPPTTRTKTRRAPSPPKIGKKPLDETKQQQIDTNTDTISLLTQKIENLTISSPLIVASKQHLLPETGSTDALATSSNYGDNGNKLITKSALENIAKAGTSTRYSFKSSAAGHTASQLSILNDSETQSTDTLKLLNGDSADDANRQISVIRPQSTVESKPELELSFSPLSASSSTNQNCNGGVVNEVEPIITLAQAKATATTTMATSHAHSSDSDTENQFKCDNNLISNLLKDFVNTTATSTAQTSSPAPYPATIEPSNNHEKSTHNNFQQSSSANQSNSIVFNFKHRKDVPDYIDNNGLVMRRQRELPKRGESGYVLLGDLSVETSTDTESDDAWTLGGPPSPCDVQFKNDNVVINGRSNIRNRTKYNKNHNIQFHEILTSLYEYPSENSICNDNNGDELTTDMDTLQNGGGGNHFMGAVPSIGSVPLGNYTPMKAATFTNFELGVTPSSSASTLSLSADSAAGINGNNGPEAKTNAKDVPTSINVNGGESTEYLKPATDEEIVVYSEGVSDLLF